MSVLFQWVSPPPAHAVFPLTLKLQEFEWLMIKKINKIHFFWPEIVLEALN